MLKRSVLLVEDNSGDARLIQVYLGLGGGDSGYEVTHAASLADALTLLRQRSFDVALVDLNLPDSSGLATIETITSVAPFMPAIVISGDGGEDMAVRAVVAGSQDLLNKNDMGPEALRRAIRLALGRRAWMASSGGGPGNEPNTHPEKASAAVSSPSDERADEDEPSVPPIFSFSTVTDEEKIHGKSSRLPILLSIYLLLALILAAVAGQWARQAYFTELEAAGRGAMDTFSAYMESELQRYTLTPRLLAWSDTARRLLAEPESLELHERANHRLSDFNTAIDGDVSYVMDRQGLTLAASNWDHPQSFVGKNYAFRDYFQDAMAGRIGRSVAVGVTSGALGFYVSAPVPGDAGPSGVAVVKYDFGRLRRLDVPGHKFILADADGVVVFASDPAWRFTLLRERTAEDVSQIEESRRYASAKLAPLWAVESQASENVRLVAVKSAGRFLVLESELPGIGWRMAVLTEVSGLSVRMILASLAAVAIIFIVAGGHLYLRQRREFIFRILTSKRRFQTIVDDQSEMLLRLSSDMRVRFVNRAYASAYGFKPPNLIGLHISDFMPAEDAEKLSGRIKNLSPVEPEIEMEQEFLMPDGRTRSLFWHVRGYFDEASHLDELQAVGNDITTLKEQEARLNETVSELRFSYSRMETQAAEAASMAEDLAAAKERAEIADKQKSDFLATMSHEIRTPLTGILGMADLLNDALTDPHQRTYAESIKGSGEILLTLLNDLLDLSKIEAGRMDIENVDFALRPIVESVLGLFSERAEKRGDQLECSIEENVPAALRGDPTRIRQILFNFVGNAIKFTEKGRILVDVSAEHKGDDLYLLRIDVTDSGVGISDEAQAKLFTRFTQADASTARQYGGSGLGLSICKKLVDLMGGEVGVISASGEGSIFWFALPCRLGDARALAKSTSTGAAIMVPARPLRILLAEDNRINRMLISAFLDDVSVIDAVENGAEAVARATSEVYDLVLMDARMPVMDGFEATHAIREAGVTSEKLPIIAVSADAMPEHVREFLSAGMDDMVVKPIDRVKLIDTIRRWTPQVEWVLRKDAKPKPQPAASAEKKESPAASSPDQDVTDLLSQMQKMI